MQGLKAVGVNNPVFLLDEVDKLVSQCDHPLSPYLPLLPLVSQAAPSRQEGLVLSFVPHDNWGVLIDHSALCAIDIHSAVGHALRLVQNKMLHCKVPDPLSKRVWLA
jgi:hypothetical protein